MFSIFQKGEEYQNANVSVKKMLGERLVALTETPVPIEFCINPLKTVDVITFSDQNDKRYGQQLIPTPGKKVIMMVQKENITPIIYVNLVKRITISFMRLKNIRAYLQLTVYLKRNYIGERSLELKILLRFTCILSGSLKTSIYCLKVRGGFDC